MYEAVGFVKRTVASFILLAALQAINSEILGFAVLSIVLIALAFRVIKEVK